LRLPLSLSTVVHCRLAFLAALTMTVLPVNITRAVVGNGHANEINPGTNAIIQASGFYGAAIAGLGTTLLLYATLRYTLWILPRFSLGVAHTWVGVCLADALVNLRGIWILGEFPAADTIRAVAFFVYSVTIAVLCILGYVATENAVQQRYETHFDLY